ncbi:MAG TPA: hypothetical protein VJB97_03240, partial [Candidatus Paceibacterota bacterium]
MVERIEFDGVTYHSVGSIAREFGLTREYLMKLCREGTVRARRAKKGWYVERESVRVFCEAQATSREARYRELKEKRAEEYGRSKEERAIPYLPIEEAAKRAELTVEYLATQCRKGAVHARKISGKWHIDERSLYAYVIREEYERALRYQNLAERAKAIRAAALESAVASQKPIPSPLLPREWLERVSALAIAVMLTFGTYALADKDTARTAARLFESTARVLVEDSGSLAASARTSVATQIAAVADHPVDSFAELVRRSARWVRSAVDEYVYAIAFPSRTRPGTVAVEIEPYGSKYVYAPEVNTSTTVINRPVSSYSSATTTIVREPTVERIFERTVERIVMAGGITEEILSAKLGELDGRLSNRILAVASQGSANSTAIVQNYNVTAQTSAIHHLASVDIENSTITGSTIDDADITNSRIRDSLFEGAVIATNITASGATDLATTTITELTATNATSTNFFATNASSTYATSTTFFSVISNFTNSVITSLTAAVATITDLVVTTITGDSAVFTNATTTNATST